MEAIIVIGPESSGTRMITEVLVKSGYFGDIGHRQRLDEERFEHANGQKLVYRQSYPHGSINDVKNWPNLSDIVRRLKEENYHNIKLIITLRDKDYTAYSQVVNNHQDNFDDAKYAIEMAIDMIFQQASDCDLDPIIVIYEAFVKMEKVRENFYKKVNIQRPNMSFIDGNEKYDQVWKITDHKRRRYYRTGQSTRV